VKNVNKKYCNKLLLEDKKKKEDEELEKTIDREIEEREKAKRNKRKPTKSEDQKR